LNNHKEKRGTLFIISTPIGNPKDITIRAVETLKKVDFVACEELRRGSTLLKKLNILEIECFELNEHNEETGTGEIIELLTAGKTVGLISDCGTPVFADPGTLLIRECIANGIKVVPIPGPSSLMAAISLSPLPLDDFYFAGFLPRRTEDRQKKLKNLSSYKCPIILLDTPYRMNKLLAEVRDFLGKNKRVTLLVDLTKQTENIFHGNIRDVSKQVEGEKAEFILIIH